MRRFKLFAALLLCGLAAAAEVSIEADNVNYTGENQFVRASGNVVIVNGDVHLQADSTTVNLAQKQLFMDEGFIFNRRQQQVVGSSLQYDYQKNEAYGEDITLTIRKNKIRGQNVTIREDSIVVENAYQTTCDQPNPCNHVTSQRLSIYPEWGNVVNDHAVIYFFFLPVMYVPNNVSDMGGNLDSMYSAIPQLGYNPVEGAYAKAGLSYYRNEKLTGALDLHYLANLGARVGFTNNYKINQANRGQLRLHYLTGLAGRTSYGFQHSTLLGVPQKDRGQIIDEFFSGILPPSKETYPELTLILTNREMVGYQWVSYLPKLNLTTPVYRAPLGLDFSLSSFWAQIHEEDIELIQNSSDLDELNFQSGTRKYLQTNWEGKVERRFGLGVFGELTPGAIYSNSAYQEKNRLTGFWKRLIYNLNYKKNWQRLNFSAGYKYTPDELGISPFNSETLYAGTSEENNFGVGWQALDNLKLNYTRYYSITEHKIRDQAYGVEFKLCHWKISVSRSEYYKQYTFGVSLQ
jgi:lipopolysaccharide assembly outer membrane protein LptD (OstA)